MSSARPDSFAGAIAACIHSDRQSIAERWLHRLDALIPVEEREIFPTETLLDHIPTLIDEIAKYVAAPEQEIVANTFVIAKARELGELRHVQNASVHQLLREYELLRGILETFVVEEASKLTLKCELPEVVDALRRINQAVALLAQVTVDTFIGRYTATIADHTRRLEAFNRMVSHELRQPLGVLQTAAGLLNTSQGDQDPSRRMRVAATIERNVERLVELVNRITKMTATRPAGDSLPDRQRVSVATIARESVRQLRDMADDREVEIRIDRDLPIVNVDVGRLELMLTNLISNGIKYSDPAKSKRFVEVLLGHSGDSECIFHVRDNGLGIPEDQLRRVFKPFYRAHADLDIAHGVEGLGLGLSIVIDCATAIGATVDISSTPGEGTMFTVTMPIEAHL